MSYLQLQHLLQQLLSEGLLDQAHALQLLPVEAQQRAAWEHSNQRVRGRVVRLPRNASDGDNATPRFENVDQSEAHLGRGTAHLPAASTLQPMDIADALITAASLTVK